MAIELNYNDLSNQAGEAAEATATGGSDNAFSSLNNTLNEVNQLMDNMTQIQQKAANMRQQGQQQPQQQSSGSMGNPPAQPSPNQGVQQQKPQQSSESSSDMLQQLDAEQVYGFITDAVIKIEEDLEDGSEATMEDLEEYLIENKDDITTLIDTGKQMLASGQAEQFIGGQNGD